MLGGVVGERGATLFWAARRMDPLRVSEATVAFHVHTPTRPRDAGKRICLVSTGFQDGGQQDVAADSGAVSLASVSSYGFQRGRIGAGLWDGM